MMARLLMMLMMMVAVSLVMSFQVSSSKLLRRPTFLSSSLVPEVSKEDRFAANLGWGGDAGGPPRTEAEKKAEALASLPVVQEDWIQ